LARRATHHQPQPLCGGGSDEKRSVLNAHQVDQVNPARLISAGYDRL
jgi:hypothetical protein